jgi:putative peptidoglycan lipid II flippase
MRAGRAAFVVAVLSVASSLLGLLRDLSLAGLFGASGETDAFLVAWTIPETISPLLDGALTALLVPIFVVELGRAGSINRVVRTTFLPWLFALTVVTAALALAAPLVVAVLAPGIADPSAAIGCVRWACLTVLFMGLAGYMMAALRAHHRFAFPAATFVAYNVGILGCMYLLHRQVGVLAAAVGLAVGSALMVAVQVPQFLQFAALKNLRWRVSRRLLLAASGVVSIAAYTIGRQAQVLVERSIASLLPAGSISYVNYASKIAQVPMLLAITAALVAFPSLARSAADPSAFRRSTELELRRVTLLIMPPTAFLLVFAQPIVQLLFQRGAFSDADTVATAAVMQIYSCGLVGQALVGVSVLVYFSSPPRTWWPAIAVIAGLTITVALDLGLLRLWGVRALALGNATGISVAAVVLLVGLRRRIKDVDHRGLWRIFIVGMPLSLASAAVAGLVCDRLFATASPTAAGAGHVVVGGILTLILCVLSGLLTGITEVTALARAVINRGGKNGGRR